MKRIAPAISLKEKRRKIEQKNSILPCSQREKQSENGEKQVILIWSKQIQPLQDEPQKTEGEIQPKCNKADRYTLIAPAKSHAERQRKRQQRLIERSRSNAASRQKISSMLKELLGTIPTWFVSDFLGEKKFNKLIKNQRQIKQLHVLNIAITYINFLSNELIIDDLERNVRGFDTSTDVVTLSELIDQESHMWIM